MADKKLTDMPSLLNPVGAVVYGVKSNTDYKISVGSMISAADAPLDGTAYFRKNGGWAVPVANDIPNFSQGVFNSLVEGDDISITYSEDNKTVTVSSNNTASLMTWMGI